MSEEKFPWEDEAPPETEKKKRAPRSDKGKARGVYMTQSLRETAAARQKEIAQMEADETRGDPVDMARAEFRITDIQWLFLKSYMGNGDINNACKVAGVPSLKVVQWRTDSPRFDLLYDYARKSMAMGIESKAYDIAFKGVEKVLYYQGVPIMDPNDPSKYMTEVNYDTKLMMKLLEANDPMKYKQKNDNPVVSVQVQIAMPPRDMDVSAWEQRNLETQSGLKMIDISPS